MPARGPAMAEDARSDSSALPLRIDISRSVSGDASTTDDDIVEGARSAALRRSVRPRFSPRSSMEGGTNRKCSSEMARAARQLKVLTWKNLRVMWRSKLWTFIEIFFSLVFFILINVIAKNMGEQTVKEQRYDVFAMNGTEVDFNSSACPMACLHNPPKGGFRIAYTTSDGDMDTASSAEKIMKQFEARFNSQIKAVSFGSRSQFEQELRSKLNEELLFCNQEYLVGVLFTKANNRNRELDYQIWMPYLSYPSFKLSQQYSTGDSPFQYSGQASRQAQPMSLKPYCETGFFAYQLALDAAFSKLVHKSEVQSRMETQALAAPKHIVRDVVTLLSFAFLLFVLMTFPVVLHTARDIASERETGMKDFLMVMGMGRGVFYVSHILLAFVKSWLALFVNCIPFYGLLVGINPAMLLVAVLLYSLSVISMSAFIASLCKTANGAIKLVMLTLVALSAVGSWWSPSRENVLLCLLTALNPNKALSYAFSAVQEALIREASLGPLNMFSESTLVMTFGLSLVMLLFDSMLFIHLAFLADRLSYMTTLDVEGVFTWLRSKWERRAERARLTEASACHLDGAEETDSALEGGRRADIEAKGLGYIWGDGKTAVEGLDLKAYRGQVTVLLGHNGAGKSTTFSMICGLIRPTSGAVNICGMNILNQQANCQERIGYCPQGNPLFTHLTVHEHLEFFARLKGIENVKWQANAESLYQTLQLTNQRDTLASVLSGGMKRKLCVGMALIGNNDVILLDEPTAGMDPGARRDIEQLLEKYKENATILMTTHYTDEAERLADRIAIMAKGRVICSGTPQFLKKRFGTGYVLSIVLAERNKEREESLARLAAKHVPGAVVSGIHALQMEITLPKEFHDHFPDLFAELERDSAALGISSFGLSLNTLEHVFIRVGELADPVDAVNTNQLAAVREIIASTDERLTGWRLAGARLRALFRKRLLYTMSHATVFFTQIIIPLGIIWLAANFLQLLDFEVSVDRKLVPSVLGRSRFALFDASLQPTSRDIAMAKISKYRNIEVVNIANKTKSDDWWLAQPRNRPPLFGGISKSGADFSLTVVHNEIYLHALPTLISFADSVRYDVNITTSLHLFSPLRGKNDTLQGGNELAKIYLLGPVLVLIFSMLTSPFISLPIVDRKSNFMHQQMLTGVSPLLFWLSNLAYDFLIYSLGCLLFAGMFVICEWIVDRLAALFILWICFYFASIFLIYTFSYVFAAPSKGQIILFFYQVIVTIFAYGLTVLADLQFMQSKIWSSFFEALFLMLVPSFALCRGGYYIARSHTHSRDGADGSDLWEWQKLGRIIFYMLIFGVLTSAIFILLQLKRVRLSIFLLWSNVWPYSKAIQPGQSGDDQEDSVVSRERTEMAEADGSSHALAVNELTKKYGRITAVDRLSFGVRPRECFGLLGVNGAGKTSTFDVITGRTFANSGHAMIYGIDVAEDVAIGYCPQFDALLPDLSGQANLQLLAAMHGFRQPKNKALSLLRCVLMEQHATKASKRYSGGQRRKISVAVALLAQNRLVILDEPTAGIDPKARREIWELLCGVRDSGDTALLLTSHSMDECEALCSRIAVLYKGRLQAIGSSQALKSKYGNSYQLTLILPEKDKTTAAIAVVARHFPTSQLRSGEGTLTINWEIARQPSDSWSSVFRRSQRVSQEVGAVDFFITQSSLETVFMRLAKQDNRTSEGEELE